MGDTLRPGSREGNINGMEKKKSKLDSKGIVSREREGDREGSYSIKQQDR